MVSEGVCVTNHYVRLHLPSEKTRRREREREQVRESEMEREMERERWRYVCVKVVF